MYFLFDSFSYLLPSLIVILVFEAILVKNLRLKDKDVSILYLFVLGVLGIYMTIIFSMTVSPTYGFSIKIDLDSVNFKPLTNLDLNNKMNVFGNIIMFMPIGFLITLLSKNLNNFLKISIIGVVLSGLIEFLQLFLSRGTDIDDIILNTIGMILGYICAKLFITTFPKIIEYIKIYDIKTGNEIKSIKIIKKIIVYMLCTVIIIGSYKVNEYNNMSYQSINQNVGGVKLKEVKSKNKKLNLKKLNLQAENLCLININKMEILLSKGKDEKIAPASTTKMLTALVVLDYVDKSEIVTVGEEISNVFSDASVAGLNVGNELSVEMLLYGLLLPSGNDCAYTLAKYTGKYILNDFNISDEKAIKAFVKKMNEKAKKIGAKNSNFKRPDGYDVFGQYSTVYDLSLIAIAFFENNLLYNISSSPYKRCVFEDGTDVTYKNTNELIDENSKYYCSDVIGGKTGSSGNAGKCIVSFANINESIYILTIMGDTEEGRWNDSIKVYNNLKKK